MSIRYSEKFVEEMIKEFPNEFLEEELDLVAQQPTLAGFRPDLIFRRQDGTIVIVEVQIEALDRAHFYRSLEYRDLYKRENPNEAVEVLVFCNSIKKKFLPIADLHGVHLRKYPKTKFVLKSKKLKPELKIRTRKKNQKPAPIYAKTIIKELGKKVPADIEVDWIPERWKNALIFCDRGWGDRRDDFTNLNLKDLKKHPRVGKVEKNNLFDIASDRENFFDVPELVIINYNQGRKANPEQVAVMRMWLDVAAYYYSDGKPEEIVLGQRSYSDYYGYESHIRNRIRKFERLWRHYDEAPPETYERKWNREQIANDLDEMKEFGLLVGAYPDFEEIKLVEYYSIEEGPGSLVRRWQDTRSNWEYCGWRDEIEGAENEINQNFKNWLTINLKFTQRLSEHHFEEALRIINRSHVNLPRGDPWRTGSGNLLFGPRKLGEVPRSSLELAARYFSHLAAIEPGRGATPEVTDES